jgi:hypothetical protein
MCPHPSIEQTVYNQIVRRLDVIEREENVRVIFAASPVVEGGAFPLLTATMTSGSSTSDLWTGICQSS